MEYDFSSVEPKWQKFWQQNQTFKAQFPSEKEKFYVLDMFPYPSGAGLHVGHPLGYIASDIYARFKRLQGFNVLHPMGYDAFGLPAEQYAIQTGQHPAKTTEENIKRYREQLDKIGFSFDWQRQVKTCEPNYYKWTQWIFIQLFNSYYCHDANKARPIMELVNVFTKEGNANINAANNQNFIFSGNDWNHFTEKQQADILLNYRLAFLSEAVVNWCPALGTVLANDEVKDGKSERGGHEVIQKKMTQWSLRITAYAQRLLDGLEKIDWSDSLKEIQTNWIGRSEGALVQFKTESGEPIEVFTTRPDTIFGVSFMVLAPEHELVAKITTPAQQAEISKYIEYTSHRSERDRLSETKKVTGAFTGAFAINPFSSKKVPIYIADYVLAGYGTGAVMAVPSGDQRDWDFAQKFGLPIPPVIEGQDVSAGAEASKDGILCNSDFLNGLPVKKAIKLAIHEIEKRGIGKKQVNYKMRDAVFGRQRYWGEPIPVYYKNGIPHAIPENCLPLTLPEIDKYLPTEDGEPPLARAEKWFWNEENQQVDTHGFPIEQTTMPGWAGSSWYFLRYMDANNANRFASPEAVNYWQQVDLYMGGAEHATGHLLYFRFWTKFLNDLGFLPFDEPAKKLINQGMIQGEPRAIINRYDNPKLENGVLKTTGTNLFVSQEIVAMVNKGAIDPIEFADLVEKKLGSDVCNELNLKQKTGIYLSPYIEGLIFDDRIHPTRTLLEVTNHLKSENIVDVLKLKDASQTFKNSFFLSMDKDLFKCDWVIEKMSKSKGNVINPDDIIAQYGADALRLHEMFLGPIEMHKPWNTKGIEGVSKFLKKLWRLFHNEQGLFEVSNEKPTAQELKSLHKAIKKFREDTERFSFNTSVSTFMIAVNELSDLKCNKREILEPLTILVSCHAPHIAEELWSKLGYSNSITFAKLPEVNESYLVEKEINYPVSFNGKMRYNLSLSADLPKDKIEDAVINNPQTEKWLEGKTPKKVIVVPGKIVNVVV